MRPYGNYWINVLFKSHNIMRISCHKYGFPAWLTGQEVHSAHLAFCLYSADFFGYHVVNYACRTVIDRDDVKTTSRVDLKDDCYDRLKKTLPYNRS